MEIISFINDKLVWGVPMLALMLFTGVRFTVGTGFFQARRFPRILRSTVFSRADKSQGISPFAAMCQALAATLGTGNIAGVSTALSIGGAGAVFWMWISAFFGMMTGFAENVLGIMYRKNENGTYRGGAMYYIRDGLAENRKTRFLSRPLSLTFALLCLISGFGMGNAAQMNSASEAMKTSFGLPPLITGIALAALAAVIVFGGVKRISAFTSKLVPLMSGFYIIGCLYIIIVNAGEIPEVFSRIIGSAFGLRQVGGGIAGTAVRTAVSMGFKRGVFSNEAGLGTSVFAHTASGIKSPVVCGMWSVFEIFFDTIVMCTLTALVLLTAPCRAESTSEALDSVSENTSYFRVTNSGGLITDGVGLPEMVTCRSIYGDSFEVTLPGGADYTNLYLVTGEKSDGRIVSARIEPVCGVGLAEYAFSSTFGKPAGYVLAVLVVMFAFSTVLGWSYFGGEAAAFLFGDRARVPYCVVFIAFSVFGAVVNMKAAWGISDMMNGLMAIPNLIAVLCLSKKVTDEVRKYEKENPRKVHKQLTSKKTTT
ncbi:MAG: sodium:alanine symporter family protein [Oscillospiraceae bacterium]|nr:sodium:alanine symporter family protein [Oscillospiraceae bacterium]